MSMGTMQFLSDRHAIAQSASQDNAPPAGLSVRPSGVTHKSSPELLQQDLDLLLCVVPCMPWQSVGRANRQGERSAVSALGSVVYQPCM